VEKTLERFESHVAERVVIRVGPVLKGWFRGDPLATGFRPGIYAHSCCTRSRTSSEQLETEMRTGARNPAREYWACFSPLVLEETPGGAGTGGLQ
jgi:hypothetical protein